MKQELKNYRVTTIEGEETIYNALMKINGQYLMFMRYEPNKSYNTLIMFTSSSVFKVETLTFADNTEGEDGAIIIPHSQFRQFSQSMEIWDTCLNGPENEDYDPAS